MTEQEAVNYWLKSSQEDLETASVLFASKKYLPCLFFCHLALEKILKGLFVVKKHTAAPLIHDLVKLSRQTELKVGKKIEEDLREISRFNIATRYDDYKFAMYKRATKEFTQKYFQKTKEAYKWLKERL